MWPLPVNSFRDYDDQGAAGIFLLNKASINLSVFVFYSMPNVKIVEPDLTARTTVCAHWSTNKKIGKEPHEDGAQRSVKGRLLR